MRKSHSIENECAIIGISMLNSHFNATNIQRTLETVHQSFRRAVFMLPDKPAEHTLAGYGYDEKEAQKKVRGKFRTLERDCRRSIADLHLSDVDIVRWEHVEQKEVYEKMLRTLYSLYQDDGAFRADVRAATDAVYIDSRFPKKTEITNEQQVDAGIHFLLKELAFILTSPELLRANDTTYLYHKEMPVLTKLLNGSYEFTPPENVHFQCVDIHGTS